MGKWGNWGNAEGGNPGACEKFRDDADRETAQDFAARTDAGARGVGGGRLSVVADWEVYLVQVVYGDVE